MTVTRSKLLWLKNPESSSCSWQQHPHSHLAITSLAPCIFLFSYVCVWSGGVCLSPCVCGSKRLWCQPLPSTSFQTHGVSFVQKRVCYRVRASLSASVWRFSFLCLLSCNKRVLPWLIYIQTWRPQLESPVLMQKARKPSMALPACQPSVVG